LSIGVNLFILALFKYYNFFIGNLQEIFSLFHINLSVRYLEILAPLGIFFYVFQSLGYVIDVYRGALQPTKNFPDFCLFVSFFPQLVAGPIERATHLLPQVLNPRKVSWQAFREGSFLFLWGLFQKIFIADNLAKIVNPFFASEPPYKGLEVLLISYAFPFQVFCDFAGYSNMARGLGKVMGFDIMKNFLTPFFVTNVRDFWRSWHISLSTWVRDYLYVPLGGSRRGVFRTSLNLMIAMVVIGLWHGPAWHFILLGVYFGSLQILYFVCQPALKLYFKRPAWLHEELWLGIRILFMFHLTCFGFLLFRVHSVKQVIYMMQGLGANFFYDGALLRSYVVYISFFVGILLWEQFMEWKRSDDLYFFRLPSFVRAGVVYALIILILFFGQFGVKEYVYFQF
jgi:D-alanyl-lipoteichoic acid acyltransferase DltB (MBOAT superfamily)